MKQRWFRRLFYRRMLISLMIVLQALFLLWLVVSGSRIFLGINGMLKFISLVVLLRVLGKKEKGAFKTAWVFLILLFPLFGGLLYLLSRFQRPTRQMRRAIRAAEDKAAALYQMPGSAYQQAKEEMGLRFSQVCYLQDCAGFPVYANCGAEYYGCGEEMLQALLPELEKAEKYIFLEYFIVQEGACWNQILQVLERKAAQGVDVRLLYDDVGCFFMVPVGFQKKLEQKNIRCGIFNPFRPFLTAKQNNRDHRKILVIDGKVAFTGGINLSDEYFNVVERFGHWKDSAVKIRGSAAWSFTLMFLQMWQVSMGGNEDFSAFYPNDSFTDPEGSMVIPYCDSPMDQENVAEHVYLQIINQAVDYVYINTPYLILDDSVLSALCLAAKRGVDVRLTTPHIADKRLVHLTTRSFYRDLVGSGVRIYEYTPGFIHAKSFVSDDCIATVGTVNLDFRSLYLHFECGAWIWKGRAVEQVKQDFLLTQQVCTEITPENCNVSVPVRLVQDLLRVFAPLM